MPITYSIKKAETEGAEDSIVKSGEDYTFLMSNVTTHMKALLKNEKEMLAQIVLEDAKMDNVLHFHEIVKTLTPEEQAAVAVYAQAMATKTAFTNKLAEVQKAIADYKVETEEIKKQTGIAYEFPTIES